MALTPALVLGEELGGINTGAIMQAQEQVGVSVSEVGIKGEGLAKGVGCRVGLTLVLLHVP